MIHTKKQQKQEEQYVFPYHYLDLKVDIYRYIYSIEYLSLIREIKKLMMPFKGQFVLDVGCGDGRLCYELKKANLEVVGVDFSERAIDFAKAFNPSVKFYVKDIKDLQLNHKFDFIILMETLEHLIPKQIPTIMKNLSKNLKKEGRLIITVPSTNLPVEKKHYQHFSEKSLMNTLKPYFKINKVIGYHKKGNEKFIFSNLQRIAVLLYPFKKRLSLTKYFKFMADYYQKNIATGPAKSCLGLIAICQKDPTFSK